MKRKTFIITTVGLFLLAVALNVVTRVAKDNEYFKGCNGSDCTVVIRQPNASAINEDLENEAANKSESTENKDGAADEDAAEAGSVSADDRANIKVTGLFNENVIVAGNNISSNPDLIKGILVAAGNTIENNGETEYTVAAGQAVYLNGTITRDAVVAGQTVSFDDESKTRDVYAAGENIYLRGELNNVNAAGKKVVLESVNINGNLNIDAAEVEFGKDVKVVGDLTFNDNAVVSTSDGVDLGYYDMVNGKISTYRDYNNYNYSTYIYVLKYASDMLVLVVSLIFVTLFVNHFAPKVYDEVFKNNFALANFGRGVVASIVIPLVILFLVMFKYTTAIGIGAGAILFGLMCLAAAPATMMMGKFVSEKVFKLKKADFFRDTLHGAAVLGFVSIIPVVNVLVLTYAEISGFGYFIKKIFYKD